MRSQVNTPLVFLTIFLSIAFLSSLSQTRDQVIENHYLINIHKTIFVKDSTCFDVITYRRPFVFLMYHDIILDSIAPKRDFDFSYGKTIQDTIKLSSGYFYNVKVDTLWNYFDINTYSQNQVPDRAIESKLTHAEITSYHNIGTNKKAFFYSYLTKVARIKPISIADSTIYLRLIVSTETNSSLREFESIEICIKHDSATIYIRSYIAENAEIVNLRHQDSSKLKMTDFKKLVKEVYNFKMNLRESYINESTKKESDFCLEYKDINDYRYYIENDIVWKDDELWENDESTEIINLHYFIYHLRLKYLKD